MWYPYPYMAFPAPPPYPPLPPPCQRCECCKDPAYLPNFKIEQDEDELRIRIEHAAFSVASSALAGSYPFAFTAREQGYQYFKDGTAQGRGAHSAPVYLVVQDGRLTISEVPLAVGYSMPAAALLSENRVESGIYPDDSTPCLHVSVTRDDENGINFVDFTLATGHQLHHTNSDGIVFTRQSFHIKGLTSDGLLIEAGQPIDDPLRILGGAS